MRRDDRGGISLSGKGRQATEKFRLEPGICLFDISHDGSSNLVIKLLDMNGKEIDTVFNQIGAFNGERAINIPRGGECLLDVEADGNWKADIRQPRSTESAKRYRARSRAMASRRVPRFSSNEGWPNSR